MKRVFRISEWKNAHLLILLTGLFIWSFYYQVEFDRFIHNLLYLFITALLLGSFGYYLNDTFDIRKDALVRKTNFASEHPPLLRLMILFLLPFLSFWAWYWLCKHETVLYLLIIEVILLILYSIPGIRIKERPVLSVLTDSIYAYVVSGMVIVTLSINTINLFNYIHLIYLLWLFTVGMRGILSHHVLDYYNDIRSGTTTSATRYGLQTIIIVQKMIIPPVEFILFILFLFNSYKPLIIVYTVYLVLLFLNRNNYKKIRNEYYLKAEAHIIKMVLDNFYYTWLPVTFITLLCISDIQYVWIVPFFIALFFKKVKTFFLDIYDLLYEWVFIAGSFIVNYSLYYSFLIIGIDLKKRAELRAKAKQVEVKPIVPVVKNNAPVLSKIEEKRVHGLWIGNQLSNMELLTIYSFIEHGYDFYLWVYNQLDNTLPQQVKICDANEIISSDHIFTYKHKSQFGNGQGSVAGFSDIFRYKLLYEKGGWWVDMDITCLEPFDVAGDYFFRAHNSLDVVGNVIKAPRGSLLMKQCYEQAIQTINEENKDWHQPIQILVENITKLNLKEHIYSEMCNTDEFQKFEKYFFSDVEIPNNWKFIHWNNEILRIYGIHKNHSYYCSVYSKLLRKYGLMPELDDHSAMDHAYRKHLLVANLKKML